MPHISSALRDLHIGNVFVVFVGSHSKIYCSKLVLPLLYIPENYWGWGYIDIFHDIILPYYLTDMLTVGE